MTKRDCALLPFALGSILLAQAPPPQGTPAVELPLSGRGTQGGSVNTVQTPVPGLTSSTNTINTTVQVQGPYAGSISGAAKPFSGKLSLREAVGRALEYNLGTEGLTQAMRQARGQAHVARSSLLPNVNGYLREAVQQENLEALGFRFHINFPGISIPTIVGPFNYYDLRATLTQTVADLTALNNYRSAQELVKANEAALRDARDLVVLAAGGAYLQVQAAGARVRSAQAQIDTAQALFKQTQERRAAGLNPQIDVNRSEVQLRTEQQRLMSLQNDLAKQKINLARVVGLPVNDNYEITDEVPYSPAPDLSVEQALKQAYENRADLAIRRRPRCAPPNGLAARRIGSTHPRWHFRPITARSASIRGNRTEHSRSWAPCVSPSGRAAASKVKRRKPMRPWASGAPNWRTCTAGSRRMCAMHFWI